LLFYRKSLPAGGFFAPLELGGDHPGKILESDADGFNHSRKRPVTVEEDNLGQARALLGGLDTRAAVRLQGYCPEATSRGEIEKAAIEFVAVHVQRLARLRILPTPLKIPDHPSHECSEVVNGPLKADYLDCGH
jgi:hypothetical protein